MSTPPESDPPPGTPAPEEKPAEQAPTPVAAEEPAGEFAVTDDEDGMAKQATRGMLWTSMGALLCRGLGFANNVVLTHLMGKAEYGKANAAFTIATSVTNFSNPGFTGELIRRRKRFEDAATLALSVSGSIVTLFCLVVATFAGPIMNAFNAEGSTSNLRVALIMVLFGTLLMIADVILCRSIRFGRQALIELGSTLCMVGASVGLAYTGWGGMAVILGQVVREVVGRTAGTAVTGLGWLRRPRWDWPLLKEMLSYGVPFWIAGMLNNIATTWDNLFVGKMLGMEMLGAYAAAYSLTYVPVYTITERITTVFYSVIVQFIDDKERRYRAVLRSMSAVLILMAPVVVLTMLVGPRFVTLVFPAKWETSVAPLVSCLALVGAGLPLQLMPDYYFGALGVRKAVIGIMVVKVVLLFGGLFLFGRTNLESAAWTVSGSFIVTGLLAFSMLSVLDKIPVIFLIRILVPGLIGGLVMAGAILGLRRLIGFSNLLMMVIEIAVGCVAYLGYELLVHRERVMDILGAFLGRGRGESQE